MLVGLFDTKPTPRGRYLLRCFEQGLAQHGDQGVWLGSAADLEASSTIDVGVQVCYPNRHTTVPDDFRFQVKTYCQRHNRRLLTIDTGFLRSQPDYELKQSDPRTKNRLPVFKLDDEKTYEAVEEAIHYQVGYDGLKREADYCNKAVPADRWQKLALPLSPWRKNGQHLLLIGQTLNGPSSQHINIHQWYKQTTQQLRRYTQRVIRFRQHPRLYQIRGNSVHQQRERKLLESWLRSLSNIVCSSAWLLEEDLNNAWAVVVCTSNAAVKAVLCGIPVITKEKSCMAFPVAEHLLSKTERPSLPEREPWLARLAYTQWNSREMVSGECWAHLRSHARR